MSAYKTYQWERDTFKTQHMIWIQPEYRVPLVKKLGLKFGIKNIDVLLSCRKEYKGWCRKTFWGYQIVLPSWDVRCPLATIIHELTHAYCGENEDEAVHHSKKFKHNLIKLMVESKALLPNIFREIRKDLELARLEAEKRGQAEIIKAQKKEIVKNFKKSRAYKIEHLKARIKRLECKEKSISTRLKSARRSLKILERFQTLEVEKNTSSSLLTSI